MLIENFFITRQDKLAETFDITRDQHTTSAWARQVQVVFKKRGWSTSRQSPAAQLATRFRTR